MRLGHWPSWSSAAVWTAVLTAATLARPPAHATQPGLNGPIAFTTASDVYTIGLDGSGLLLLTDNACCDTTASWSPDGTKIVFSSTRTSPSDVYVMDADGGNVKRLTVNASNDVHPAWSPDGAKIAFASDREAGQYDIFVMDTDGKNQTRLTTNAATETLPRCSPDGTKILYLTQFAWNQPGTTGSYVMSANGSGPTLVAGGGYDAD